MKNKLAVIAIILISVIFLLVNTVSAASFTATITPNKTTVAESTEFTVIIRVSNLDVGSTGINTLEGVLSYSTQVFETLSSDSFDGLGGWQPTYNQDTGKIMLYKQGFLNEDADILQITFKTKTNVTGKTGDIKFSDIKASNSEETVAANTISTTITIGNTTTGENLSNSSSTGTNTSSNNSSSSSGSSSSSSSSSGSSSSSSNGSSSSNTNKTVTNILTSNSVTNIASNSTKGNTTNSNTTAQSSYINSNGANSINATTSQGEDIPYTGASDNVMKAIFVVLVIAGISYFKYESIKEN